MPAGMVELQVLGAQQLALISKRMLQEEKYAERIELRNTLRNAVAPAIRDIQRDARVNSKTVAAAITSVVLLDGKAAKVVVKVDPAKLPARKKRLGQLFEFGSRGSGGRFIRHPVFGNRNVWVNQPIRRYFYGNVRRRIPQIQGALLEVVEDMAKRISR